MFAWLQSILRRPLADRRTALRRKTKVDDQLQAIIGPSGWPALVQAISCEEIELVAGIWQKAGAPLLVRLMNRRTGAGCQAQTRVVRTVRRRDGSWKLSCAFDRMLQPQQFDALV